MKTALITGCSSGYGKATADNFAAHGWNVVATMRRPDPEMFRSSGPGAVRVVRMDVTDADSIDQAIAQGLEAFGQIDVLVNNAGIGLLSPLESTPLATIREVFETNTFGVMRTSQAVIPLMRERGQGTIINVTSSVCFAGMPLVAPYAASKWAIEGFTEALYYELHSVGVRVRLVEPGYGPGTAFTANGMPRMSGLVTAPYEAYAAQLFAQLGAPGAAVTTPEQVAAAIHAAATEESEQLRFPAGPDSEHLANARWHSSDAEFLAGMQAMLRLQRRPAR
ncbi:SDR family oxidoreductase [Achromobacter sp. SIMBA_011]|uniref:SDR family oxidoreductase n=1 Tax=Achromobacter sp. SIMBA_011 TaxID=3085759 RepID=UPI003979D178